MYQKVIFDIKIIYFYFGVNRTTLSDKWPNQEVKKQRGKKIEILIYGHICCITLHFSKKHMKKYACYKNNK